MVGGWIAPKTEKVSQALEKVSHALEKVSQALEKVLQALEKVTNEVGASHITAGKFHSAVVGTYIDAGRCSGHHIRYAEDIVRFPPC